MALVVFMRGVNVGGHKTFQPSALAKRLAALDVVNVGAAGTFVVRKGIAAAALRAELLRRMPFEAELMICKAAEVVKLVREDPFPAAADVTRYVTVMAHRPRALPALPLEQPAGSQWQVKVLGIMGTFAVSHWTRRAGRNLLYPNQVIEKQLGIPATTRNWSTLATLAGILTARP